MVEWVHHGETIGNIQSIIVGDTTVDIRTENETKTYDRESMNLDIMLREIPPSIDVIRTD